MSRRDTDALLSLQAFFHAALPAPWTVWRVLEEGDDPQRPFALVEQAGDAETDGAPAVQQVTIPFTVNLYLASAETRKGADDAAAEVREQVWQAVKWGPNPRQRTTDRIPLFSWRDRVERHRIRATATGGTCTVSIGTATTDPLTPDMLADDVANSIAAALIADGQDLDPSDVVGYQRGVGLWEIAYGGKLAGTRVGDPSIDGSDLTGPGVVAEARTILEGTPAPWRGPSDYMRVESFAQNTVRDPDDPKLVMVAVDLRLTFVRGLPLPLDQRILQRIE